MLKKWYVINTSMLRSYVIETSIFNQNNFFCNMEAHADEMKERNTAMLL